MLKVLTHTMFACKVGYMWLAMASLWSQLQGLFGEELVGTIGGTINCPSDGSDTPTEDCVVTCGEGNNLATSCTAATINCRGYGFGNSFKCTILCAGDTSSGCFAAKINMINTFKSDVECSGRLSCQAATITEVPLYGTQNGLASCNSIPAAAKAGLSFKSTVKCLGSGSCSSLRYVIEQNSDCFSFPGNIFFIGRLQLECDGFMSCALASVVSTQNSRVNVLCNNQMSCLYLTMDGFNDALGQLFCASDDQFDANWQSNTDDNDLYNTLPTIVYPGMTDIINYGDVVYRGCEQISVRYATADWFQLFCEGSSCGSISFVCPIGGRLCNTNLDANDPGVDNLDWPQTRDILISTLEGGTQIDIQNGQTISSGVTMFCSYRFHQVCQVTAPSSSLSSLCPLCYPRADTSSMDPTAKAGLEQTYAPFSIKNADISYVDRFTALGGAGGSTSDLTVSCGSVTGPYALGCVLFWVRSPGLISVLSLKAEDIEQANLRGADLVNTVSLAPNLESVMQCENMVICAVLIVCNGHPGCKSRVIIRQNEKVTFTITPGGGRTVSTPRSRRVMQDADVLALVELEIEASEVEQIILRCEEERACSNTTVSSPDGTVDLSNIILVGCTIENALNCDGLQVNTSDSVCEAVVTGANIVECYDVETGELTGIIDSFDTWNECQVCTESDAAELTPESNANDFAVMSMVENPGFNVEDVCYVCDNSEYDSFCVELDILSLGATSCNSGTELINISVSATRVSGDTDMFSIISVGDEYVAVANDFDNGQGVKIRGGKNAKKGGVFIAPQCPSGDLLSYSDDFVNILSQDAVGYDGPNSFRNRYLLADGNTHNWKRLTEKRVGPSIAPGDSATVTFSIMNDLSNDELTIGFTSDNIDVNEAECDYSTGSAFDTADSTPYKVLLGADAGVIEICGVQVERTCV